MKTLITPNHAPLWNQPLQRPSFAVTEAVSGDMVQLSRRASLALEESRGQKSPRAMMKEHRRLMGDVEDAYQPYLESVVHRAQAEEEVLPVLEPEEQERFRASMDEQMEKSALVGREAVDALVEHAYQPAFEDSFAQLPAAEQMEFLTNAGQVFPDSEKGRAWVAEFLDGLEDPETDNEFSRAAQELLERDDLPTGHRKKLEASLSWMVATDEKDADPGVSEGALHLSEGESLWVTPGMKGVALAVGAGTQMELPVLATAALSGLGMANTLLGQGRSLLGGGMALVELVSGDTSAVNIASLMTNVGSGVLSVATGGVATAATAILVAGYLLKYGPKALERSPYHRFVDSSLEGAGIEESKHRAVMTGFGVQGGLQQVFNDAEKLDLEPWEVMNTAIEVRDQHARGSYYTGGGPWDYIHSGYGQFYYLRALEAVAA